MVHYGFCQSPTLVRILCKIIHVFAFSYFLLACLFLTSDISVSEYSLKHYTNSRTSLIRTLLIRISNYPDRLGPPGKFFAKSIKLTRLEITSYRTKYSTVLWLLELQIRRGRKVRTQVHAVNSNSRTAK
jgi:hypothetical protein